ncbi:MAG: Maf family protein [SAR324 cluster bacterium]|nr:Maf family protein [SAR324 cluster bacterium]
MKQTCPYCLASASPRRKELLERFGFRFEVLPTHVDESALPGERPEELVARLARLKGTLWNYLYHIKPEHRPDSLLTEKQWTAFRPQYVTELDDTVENYKNIAHRYPLENTEADTLGICCMIRNIRGEQFEKRIGENPGSGAGGKGNGKGNKNNGKGNGKNDGDNGDNGDEDEPKVWKFASIEGKISKADDMLQALEENLNNSVKDPAFSDMLDNTHATDSLLKQAEKQLVRLRQRIRKVRAVIKQIRNSLEANDRAERAIQLRTPQLVTT